jgi:heat-inducible transcriptional repressor
VALLVPATPTIRLQRIDFVGFEGSRVWSSSWRPAVASPQGHRHGGRYSATTCAAANYIARLPASRAREAIVERLREERLLYDVLMNRALKLAQTGLAEVEPEETLFVQGASFLIDELASESADRQSALETLRLLFHMIEEKHQLIDLLTRSIEANGLTVVIGSEHRSPDLHPFSLIATTFQDGDRSGTIGVIGPTRMRYQRAISVVDGVSQAVNRLLEGQ